MYYALKNAEHMWIYIPHGELVSSNSYSPNLPVNEGSSPLFLTIMAVI
jgi:hypothetical protein